MDGTPTFRVRRILERIAAKEAKRVRFGLIDVVLAVVFIILLVLLIRRLVS